MKYISGITKSFIETYATSMIVGSLCVLITTVVVKNDRVKINPSKIEKIFVSMN